MDAESTPHPQTKTQSINQKNKQTQAMPETQVQKACWVMFFLWQGLTVWPRLALAEVFLPEAP